MTVIPYSKPVTLLYEMRNCKERKNRALAFGDLALPLVSDVDIQVLRDRNPRTVSGWEQSSTKWNLSVRREAAWIELTAIVTLMQTLQSQSRGLLYKLNVTHQATVSEKKM